MIELLFLSKMCIYSDQTHYLIRKCSSALARHQIINFTLTEIRLLCDNIKIASKLNISFDAVNRIPFFKMIQYFIATDTCFQNCTYQFHPI